MGEWKKICVRIAVVCLAVLVTGGTLWLLFFSSGTVRYSVQESKDVVIMDHFDMNVNNDVSDALEGIMAVEKVYWLSDDDLVAPKPDPAKYGRSRDPSSLGWLLETASELLEGQTFHFSTETVIAPGTEVCYYLDKTIFAVTWKEVIDGGIYTFSEVKLSHPSQFRRFLAGGEYGSPERLTTTEMASTVNAVVASSGDFYDFRTLGVIVYDGKVRRVDNAYYVDTCYVDSQGDLHFSYAGELTDMASAQAFVDEHDIRFSLAFGPVLVDQGEPVYLDEYFLGQIEDPYPRAALLQMDKLHYIVMVVNGEGNYPYTADLFTFAWRVDELRPKMAYTLDGGQTAVIAMDGQLINAVLKGSQRGISDIIYFATAVPEGE